MGEFVSDPRDPKDVLIEAIEAGSMDEIISAIEECEEGLSHAVVEAAENSQNPEIIDAVVENITYMGLNPPHDFPTHIHWAIISGFPMSAEYLAGIIHKVDLVDTYEGKTPIEWAKEKGMAGVVEELQRQEGSGQK